MAVVDPTVERTRDREGHEPEAGTTEHEPRHGGIARVPVTDRRTEQQARARQV